jgi:DNA-binding response OmpR family regulator
MSIFPLKIMVIEDYDALREAMCDVLSRDGHEVVGVSMAEKVDDEPTGFVSDLYIIDLNLPGEDGISLAQRIRRSQPDVCIVQRILSAESSREFSVTLGPMKMVVTGPSGEARLIQPEVLLLATLSREAQRDLGHWQVAAHLGGGEEISKENLEVKLGRLRKKLISCGAKAPAIQSLRGIGYRLTIPIEVLRD